HDRILVEHLSPLVEEIRESPALDSFFFLRYQDPDWQLRFRVLGRPDWIEGEVPGRVEAAIEDARAAGLVTAVEVGEYQREWDRYGGPLGMRLAERIFLHDSIACLARLRAEARGAMLRSRREHALVHMERFLGLMGLDRSARAEVHRLGHQGFLDEG